MPREPPPPYSSHDPSSPSTPPSAAAVRIQTAQQKEHDLKATLKKTTQAAKEAESSLQGPLGALKRQLEKSHKEDQRARQKISTLEEATRKIREAIQHEAVLMEDLHAEIEPLQAECDALAGELEGQKERWQAADLAAKEAVEADEDATQRLKDQLDELISREEGLEAERARYEDEVR
jgi:chromosome segregation ATPase